MRGVAALALILCLGSSGVQAHGDASWIMENPVTARCCGPHDCEMMADDDVTEVKGGFRINQTGEVVRYDSGERQIFTSIDEHYWWCHYAGYSGSDPVMHTRCLFVPGNT